MSVKTKAPPPDTVQDIISDSFGLCERKIAFFDLTFDENHPECEFFSGKPKLFKVHKKPA